MYKSAYWIPLSIISLFSSHKSWHIGKIREVGIIKGRINTHYFLNINNRSFILAKSIKPYIRISTKSSIFRFYPPNKGSRLETISKAQLWAVFWVPSTASCSNGNLSLDFKTLQSSYLFFVDRPVFLCVVRDRWSLEEHSLSFPYI